MRRAIFAVFLLLSCASASADTCIPPQDGKERTFESENGAWRVVVRWPDRATLYRKGAWRRQARWTMLNPPAAVQVANDGTVITSGIPCAMGIDHAVVIYRPDGSLVRQLALKDFLQEEDIAAFPRTVSSIDWSGVHRIEEEKRQLILQVKRPSRMVELLVPKVRRFLFPRFFPEISYGVADGVPSKCEGVAIGSAELLALASEPVNAVYPPVAIKARLAGTVVLELAVKEDGSVEAVTVIQPLPFGIDQAAVTAARKWKFQASQGRVCGRIAMNFRLIEPARPAALVAPPRHVRLPVGGF
ncbi:MAG TPA: energy transducer TonB [Thermoanaerobaculia bacterium]|jgi:TonB family protein|nr:energy transducer TonB [Thermoanaerobaculia bacterium]